MARAAQNFHGLLVWKLSRVTKICHGLLFIIFCSLEKSALHVLILMCPRGVFLHQFCDTKVTRGTFWGVTSYFFDFATVYFLFHGLVMAKLSRAMSRLTLALKNVTVYLRVTGYFFEKCHGLVEKCHGKKKTLILLVRHVYLC